MSVVAFSRWRFSRVCIICEEGETCHCTDEIKGSLWLLNGTSGMVQQFHGGSSFYGTWADGRTGAMETLDDCKAAVEKAVWH
ncbi:hypothetical protein NKL07_22145 [Mesorhizobium sp. C280B]|uniref:hypothetical protein n=1 Tax=unclassified Mesorhizobium TaxID=325217 RepID=UPI0003CEF065|nr:hypothetical protein [Mesorhizobium sp. LSJC280B00]ESW92969.1 hypothetical protein X772_03250 [Mesorhizobium sp. LSJC280B00]